MTGRASARQFRRNLQRIPCFNIPKASETNSPPFLRRLLNGFGASRVLNRWREKYWLIENGKEIEFRKEEEKSQRKVGWFLSIYHYIIVDEILSLSLSLSPCFCLTVSISHPLVSHILVSRFGPPLASDHYWLVNCVIQYLHLSGSRLHCQSVRFTLSRFWLLRKW